MSGPLSIPQPEERAAAAPRREAARLAICALLTLLGAAVLVGWFADIEPLKSVLPGLSTMKANAACGFLLAGLGLAAIGRGRGGRAVATGCAGLILAIGLLTLVQYPLALDLGIDELLVTDLGTLRGSGHPGRMSPLTALAWTALAPAILLLAWSRRRQAIVVAHAFGLAVGSLAFLAVAGYAFGAEAFWGIGVYTAIAAHSALGLAGITAATLMTRADEAWLAPYRDSPEARLLLARILPLSVAMPFALGLLVLLGSGVGAYNAAYGFALLIPATAIAMGLVALGAARRLRHGELRLRRSRAALHRSEEKLRALNDTLEQRIAAEVAERTKAEDALRQAQKLESLGQLTGGVAHDFNNLLTPIIGGLDLLQRRGAGDERSRRLVEGALRSAERARNLVQRLLAFARRQPLRPAAVDLAALIGNMAELIASTSGPRIRLDLDLEPDLPAVLADANQLEMAILNLSVNARDAMPDGGALTIAAAAAEVAAGQPSGPAPGRYVRLSVADSGAGMEEAVLARAIEPFFSTKGVGHGTGLGLSMVHGLMAQLGGAMTVESRVGLGTCVSLWLPQAGEAAPATPAAARGEAPRAARGTALLVDDEPLVRASVAEMLADLGYSVVETQSAAEALARLEDGLVIDLLVADHLMQGQTGSELARAIRARFPQVRVLVISGNADVDATADDLPRLTKPFRQEELEALIARED
jgi:signal transduction histidine kinase/CheY-like chemotaxis protein